MAQQWLKIDGMTCGSCERLIEREAGKLGVKIRQIDGSRGVASVELPEHNSGGHAELTPLGNLVEALSAKGYPTKAISDSEAAEITAREPKAFEEEAGEFMRHFFGSHPQYRLERNMFWQSIMLTVVLIGLELLMFMGWFSHSNFPLAKVPYLFYLVIGVVGNVAILWHLRAYPRITSHMDGMMIGMTAGIMGGTMGPMISVMMVLDHIDYFMPLFILSTVAVLFGLTYMLILSPGRGPARKPDWDFPSFAAICLSAVLLLSALIVWGPKGAAVI